MVVYTDACAVVKPSRPNAENSTNAMFFRFPVNTAKRQVEAIYDRVAMASSDQLRDYRIVSSGASLPLRPSR